MKFTVLLCLALFLVSLQAYAKDIETIEVLAPKKTLSVDNGQLVFVHENFSFTQNRTVADKLVTIPGVSYNGQGGQFQSYNIRGFSRNRIRTEVDGIPIITDRRAGNSASFISPQLIAVSSVIKGPSSVLYGSQSMGGVVGLSTEISESNSVMAEFGVNYGLANVTVKVRDENIAAGISYQHSDNEYAPDGSELNTGYERVSGALKYVLQGENVTTTYSWLPSYGKDIGKSNARYPEQEVSDYPSELHSLAQVQWNANDNWLAKVFHHYQNWQSDTLRVVQYRGISDYQAHTLGAHALKEYAWNDVTLYFGMDWLARKGVDISNSYTLFNSDITLPNSQLQGKEDNLALFNKTQWELLEIGRASCRERVCMFV